jgi:hypothetical protein
MIQRRMREIIWKTLEMEERKYRITKKKKQA